MDLVPVTLLLPWKDFCLWCGPIGGAEEYPIPDFVAAPSDANFVLHLRSRLQQYESDLQLCDFSFHRFCHFVNAHLVRMNPWEIPGISAHDKQGKTGPKCFVTNFIEFGRPSDGSWKPRVYGWGIPLPGNYGKFMGLKRTFRFYLNDGTKTHWIMNMYYTIDETGFNKHNMVLREIFENKSADYDPRPECVHHNGVSSLGKTPIVISPMSYYGYQRLSHGGEIAWTQKTIGAGSSSLFGGMNPGRPSSSSAPQGFKQYSYQHPQHPVASSLEQLNNVLFGDPDTTITDYNQTGGRWSSTDNFIRSTNSINGTQKKRRLKTGTPRRTSPVWDRFTKVFDKRPDGVTLVLSICHHCCKVLTGDSSGGTSHMLRHKCSCNHHTHDNSGGMEHQHGHHVPGSSTAMMNTGRCSSPALNAAAVTLEQACPQPQLAAGTTGNTAAAVLHQLPAGDYGMWTDEDLNSLITTPLYSDDDICRN